MNKSDLERITDGLAQGGNSPAPNNHNLVGATNALVSVVETMDKYGITAVSDLPQEEQDKLADAQEDLQYLEAELGGLLGNFTGNDGSIELDDGSSIDLPNAATSASTNVDLPDAGGN